MPSPAAMLRAAREISQRDGFRSVLSRGWSYASGSFFQYASVYLYEHTMREQREADFLPRVQDFTVKIVASNREADELMALGFDFRSYVFYGRDALDRGAVAFCIFIGGELAHLGWAAFSEEGKAYIDPMPFRVAFSAREACTGGTRTVSKFEEKGLMTYGYYLRLEYLRQKGMVLSRNSVATGNVASQKVHAKFGPRVYARARYLRILWWESWKEVPLPATDL